MEKKLKMKKSEEAGSGVSNSIIRVKEISLYNKHYERKYQPHI